MKLLIAPIFLAHALLLTPAAALAQASGWDPYNDHHKPASDVDTVGLLPGMDTRPGHEMAADDMATMEESAMTMMGGALAAYPMTRDASGTAWQPDAAPMMGIMGQSGAWSTMLHGYATAIYDNQGGPRGDSKSVVASMLMGMAQKPLGAGTLTLRAMGSLDPLMGKRGYPLLLATGETADGETELVDRQHPHDLFMELAAVYSRPLGDKLSGFVYVGLPGEPALGPATYMHRLAGLANPEAPIDHHWLDSTHVTFGVATAGLVYDNVKLEASSFTGREPDEDRWDIERPRFDSWAVRATWNPTANLSMQASRGRLNSPEGLHPEEDVRRTTASLTYDRAFGENRRWEATFAWGRNDPTGGHDAQVTDAFLAEAAVQLGANTLFGRAERVDKDELFGDADPLHGQVFTVGKLSVGGYRSFPIGPPSSSWAAIDLGGLVSRYDLPGAIQTAYGSDPTSFMAFARFRITG
jgi:hypothetical protein